MGPAALAGLLAAACAGSPALDDEALADAVPVAVVPDDPGAVDDVACPAGLPDDRITVTCSATVAGAPVEVVVDVLDDGEVTFRLVEPLFDVAAAADQLASRFTTDLGVETTVTCEPPAVRVAVAGTTVRCSAVDPGGVARDFVVEVLDEDGAWSVAIAS